MTNVYAVLIIHYDNQNYMQHKEVELYSINDHDYLDIGTMKI